MQVTQIPSKGHSLPKGRPVHRGKSSHWRYLVSDQVLLDEPGKPNTPSDVNSGLDNALDNTTDYSEIPFSKLLTEAIEVHSSLATHVYQAQLLTGDRQQTVFVKQFHTRSRFDQCKQLVRKSRAMKAITADSMLNALGFIAPRTLIIGWQQRYGIKTRFFTVSTALEGYSDIYNQVEAFGKLETKALRRQAKRGFLIALGTATATLHKANISHGDMRPGNVFCKLVASKPSNTKEGDTWEFAYIDNERTKKHWCLPTRMRIKNLVQLNLLISPYISRSDRLCFFQAYCDHCYSEFNDRLLSQVLDKTRRRIIRLLNTNRIQQSDIWL